MSSTKVLGIMLASLVTCIIMLLFVTVFIAPSPYVGSAELFVARMAFFPMCGIAGFFWWHVLVERD